MFFNRMTILFILISLSLYGCTKSSNKINQNRGEWLASIESDTIYTNEFLSRYESTPHFGMGLSGGSDYLKAMVVERILGEYGKNTPKDVRLDRYERFANQLANEILVENLLLSEITKRVTVSESEKRAHYKRLSNVLILNAIAVKDSLNANAIASRMRSGAVLNEVVKKYGSMINNVIVEQRLSYNESDPVFEEVAYSLDTGEFSEPVYSSGSWWILNPVKIEPSRIQSEDDYEGKIDYLESVIKKRKMKFEQIDYINEIMLGKSTDVNEDIFVELSAKLKDVISSMVDDNEEKPRMIAVRNFEIQTDSEFREDETLLELKGFSKNRISLGEALEWFSVSPRNIKYPLDKMFSQRIFNELLYMAEFQALVEEAKKNNLSSDPTVIDDTKLWQNHIYGQYGMTCLSLETGKRMHALGVVDPEGSDMSLADSLMVAAIDSMASKLNVRFNWSSLTKLDLDSSPVFLKKTHFPVRPMAPMPIGYRWAMIWEP